MVLGPIAENRFETCKIAIVTEKPDQNAVPISHFALGSVENLKTTQPGPTNVPLNRSQPAHTADIPAMNPMPVPKISGFEMRRERVHDALTSIARRLTSSSPAARSLGDACCSRVYHCGDATSNGRRLALYRFFIFLATGLVVRELWESKLRVKTLLILLLDLPVPDSLSGLV
jgi:hypothetical protein